MTRGGARSSWGYPWLALTGSLAVHVLDEALNDFLSLWNPLVLRVREEVPWSPLPTFSYRAWAAGLVLAVAVLALLSVYAFRGSRGLRPLAYAFGVLMLFNALAHLVASVYLGRWAPGVYSSPLLLVTSVWLLLRLVRSRSLLGAAGASGAP